MRRSTSDLWGEQSGTMQVSDHGTHEARKRALLGEAYDRVNTVRIENIVDGRARSQRRLSTDHCILEVSLAG